MEYHLEYHYALWVYLRTLGRSMAVSVSVWSPRESF